MVTKEDYIYQKKKKKGKKSPLKLRMIFMLPQANNNTRKVNVFLKSPILKKPKINKKRTNGQKKKVISSCNILEGIFLILLFVIWLPKSAMVTVLP